MTKRISYISNVKAIAALAVVFVHSTGPFFYQLNSLPFRTWSTIAAYDSFVRFCVPFFLMASGALLLGRDYNLKQWLTDKLLIRLMLPFVFYTLINSLVNNNFLQTISHPLEIKYYMPFVMVIMSLYLIYPLLRIMVKGASTQLLKYFLIVWFILNVLQFWLPTFPYISLQLIYGYIGYPVIGYMLTRVQTSKYKWWSLFAYVLMSAATAAATIYSTQKHHVPIERYYDYLSPVVVIMTVSLYIFIKEASMRIHKSLIPVRDFISDHSYGLYLLHPILILKIAPIFSNQKAYLSNWIIFILTASMSLLSLFIIGKLKFINKLIG